MCSPSHLTAAGAANTGAPQADLEAMRKLKGKAPKVETADDDEEEDDEDFEAV